MLSTFLPIFVLQKMVNTKFKILCNSNIIRYFVRNNSQETFQSRILNYLEDSMKCKLLVKCNSLDDQLSLKYEKFDFKYFKENPSKVKETFSWIYRRIENGWPQKNIKFLKNVDQQCYSFTFLLNSQQTLCLLNKFVRFCIINRYDVADSKFYKQAISSLFAKFKQGHLSVQEVIQFIYYLSLNKEELNKIELTSDSLPEMSKLTLMEKAIISQSMYRRQLQLPNQVCTEFEKTIQNQAEELVNDRYLLVALCKSLRISQWDEIKSLSNLSKAIVEAKEDFNLIEGAYILRLYFNCSILELDAIERLKKDSIAEILEERKSPPSLKDFIRFLDIIALMGLDVNEEDKKDLRWAFTNRIDQLLEGKNLYLLISGMLSLHMMQCHSSKLLNHCLKHGIFEPIYEINDEENRKLKLKFQLLLTQMEIELKMKIPDSLQQTVLCYETETSEGLNRVYNIAKKYVEDIKIEAPFKGLLINGLTITHDDGYTILIITCVIFENLIFL